MPLAIAVLETTYYATPVYRILKVYENAKTYDELVRDKPNVAKEHNVRMSDLIIVYAQ